MYGGLKASELLFSALIAARCLKGRHASPSIHTLEATESATFEGRGGRGLFVQAGIVRAVALRQIGQQGNGRTRTAGQEITLHLLCRSYVGCRRQMAPGSRDERTGRDLLFGQSKGDTRLVKYYRLHESSDPSVQCQTGWLQCVWSNKPAVCRKI